MWNLRLLLAMLATGIIVYFFYTIVFCFWFIYLVDAMKRKRSFYKATLRCVEGESDPHEQMLAYNAKTELVKFVFLFCLNLVEWIGLTFAYIAFSLYLIGENHQKFAAINFLHVLGELDSKLDFILFSNSFIVMSMAILGSLCMYLSARYAQKSWIKSNRTPYWISFFLFSSIASQILDTICYTHIIGMWCDMILVTLSVIFAWKQYRKLNMVLQWSIVDLRVKGDIELLDRHVRMKRRFNRIFTAIWIGMSCVLVADFTDLISQTTQITLGMYNHPFIDNCGCGTSTHSDFVSYIFSFLYLMEGSFSIIGFFIFFIPYIGFGLCTMFVLLWRLFKGKTGYRTHFHVQLTDPLIKP